MKRWLLKRTKLEIETIAKELGIRRATAVVLAHRGIRERKQAKTFLQGEMADLHPPYLMKGMAEGIGLIAEAIREKKKITVYGDYDVDGVMSTTILYRTICALGGAASYYLPHRQREGYGLNMEAVEQLAAEGTQVLFTCDNGISAIAEIAKAVELGMEVVVLDHHEPSFCEENEERHDVLPSAQVIIDPKQRTCTYPFSALCAGGLAYKFAIALLQEFGQQEADLEKQILSFAAIATVCDIVDLLDENRILVQKGLVEINRTKNIGLEALLAQAGLTDQEITEYHLGFVIGPCINAAGRLMSAEKAVELFCTDKKEQAQAAAQALTELNAERKKLTAEAGEKMLAEATEMQDKVLVLYGKEMHESIAGIVAGRIKERLYRPVILITAGEDGAKGSGRSIEGYHLFDALSACKDLFTRFGGHAMAAGLSLPEENIPLLRERLNRECPLTEEDLIPVLKVDCKLEFSEIDLGLATELGGLAPFGKENHAPLFASTGLTVDRIDRMGKERDSLRLTCREEKSGIRQKAIFFRGYDAVYEALKELYPQEECDKMIESGQLPKKVDLVYSVDVNHYMGRSTVQLVIKDFRFTT